MEIINSNTNTSRIRVNSKIDPGWIRNDRCPRRIIIVSTEYQLVEWDNHGGAAALAVFRRNAFPS